MFELRKNPSAQLVHIVVEVQSIQILGQEVQVPVMVPVKNPTLHAVQAALSAGVVHVEHDVWQALQAGGEAAGFQIIPTGQNSGLMQLAPHDMHNPPVRSLPASHCMQVGLKRQTRQLSGHGEQVFEAFRPLRNRQYKQLLEMSAHYLQPVAQGMQAPEFGKKPDIQYKQLDRLVQYRQLLLHGEGDVLVVVE